MSRKRTKYTIKEANAYVERISVEEEVEKRIHDNNLLYFIDKSNLDEIEEEIKKKKKKLSEDLYHSLNNEYEIISKAKTRIVEVEKKYESDVDYIFANREYKELLTVSEEEKKKKLCEDKEHSLINEREIIIKAKSRIYEVKKKYKFDVDYLFDNREYKELLTAVEDEKEHIDAERCSLIHKFRCDIKPECKENGCTNKSEHEH